MTFNWFPILWLGFVFIIIIVNIANLFVVPYKGKQRIRAYLAASGAQNITVSYHWFGGDRYTSTYDVTYEDMAGHSYSTACVMSSSFWGEKPIYWLDGPRGAAPVAASDYQLSGAGSPKRALPPENKRTAVPASSKDQLISQLLAENKQLRLELQRLQTK